MSNKSRLQTNNANLQLLIDKAASLPEAGSGGNSGSGTAGGETCTVEIIVPMGVCVFGWGVYDVYISADDGASWMSIGTNLTMPGTGVIAITCL